MNFRDLAEYARRAEQGGADEAAQACLERAVDVDAPILEAAMRYGLLSSDVVEDFHIRDRCAYCVRVPGRGEFWLAPLDAWAQLPPRSAVVSPRGLKALGEALVRALVAA